jgi:hypothetical protein
LIRHFHGAESAALPSQLLGGEGGEAGRLAEVDAECALVAGVGEGHFEGIRRLTDLIGFDGGAGDVLFSS